MGMASRGIAAPARLPAGMPSGKLARECSTLVPEWGLVSANGSAVWTGKTLHARTPMKAH